MTAESCTWCGAEVEDDDGYRAYERVGRRRAVFCRLEHLIPWSIREAQWGAGSFPEAPGTDEGQLRCSHCEAELDEVPLLLVRHRGEHRVPDAFCSVDHMAAWAKAGGRWQ